MFYKVVYEGTVIDVLNDPRFVKRNKYNLKVLCPKDEATMVLSSDAEVTYTLNDHALLGIPESEYKELKDRLFKSGPVEPEKVQGYNNTNTEQLFKYSTSQAALVADLQNRIAVLTESNRNLTQANSELAEKLQEQTETNNNLENCLLELSEIVYA